MCTDSIPLHLLNTQPVQQSHLFYLVVPFSVYYTEDAIPKARQQLMNQDFVKCPPFQEKKSTMNTQVFLCNIVSRFSVNPIHVYIEVFKYSIYTLSLSPLPHAFKYSSSCKSEVSTVPEYRTRQYYSILMIIILTVTVKQCFS